MLANENLWIRATHGYFENGNPAVHGVTDSKVDLANFPYDVDGRTSGSISMNGLVVASTLAMVRGSFHYSVNTALNEDDSQIIWAEYTPEAKDRKRDTVYLMKIRINNVSGINYSYHRISSAEILKYDANTHQFYPPWTEDEVSGMELAPALSLIPVITAVCALDEETEKKVMSLKHLPENKYIENPDIYWLSNYFYSARSEFYNSMDSISALKEDEAQLFISKYLENLVDWDFKDIYRTKSSLTFGDIGYDELARVFSAQLDEDSALRRMIPDIDLNDYYIDPKVKSVVDLLVMEKDSRFPINTGMLYGPPASGKSTAVMLMAKMLELPYVPVTFNSNISMDDLLGSWQPSEDGRIHFMESTFVQAYQSPSVVEFVECYYVKPGACGDLNTALDETAQITLPDGRIIHRHPFCFIVATMNAGENENEYRAVREQDASFDRRFEGFKEYLDFFREDVFADMISRKSGYGDTDEILLMIRVMKDMNKSADETGDWQVVYPSTVIRWAQHRKYKDIITAARSTILPAASKNLEVQKEIMDSILNNYW